MEKCVNLKEQRLGEEKLNNQGCLMKVIKYNNRKDIDILFVENNKVLYNKRYDVFKNGEIKNPYFPNLYDIGYFGEGEVKTNSNIYNTWNNMLKRCYDKKYQKKQPTYIGCSACEEWHNFQNFAKWYEENYYDIDDEIMCLDKDILIKGNKIYSPETCVFVPKIINSLFTKRQNKRGLLPIGVTYYKNNKKYRAQCCHLEKGKDRYLGLYNTPEEAFEVYKKEKERYIKQVADEYKSKYHQFPQKLYNAMYNYQVEITD